MFLFSSRRLRLLGRPTWSDSRRSWRGRQLSWSGRSRRCRTGAEHRTLAVSSRTTVRPNAPLRSFIHSFIHSSVVCLQLEKTTGRLCRSSPLWGRASIRTLRRRSQRSTAGSAGGCITSGCVCTSCTDCALDDSESTWWASCSSSPQRHAVPQRVGLPGLFHCKCCECRRLRSVHPLVHPLHSSVLCLLVPARLQGLQVHCFWSQLQALR